MPLNSAQQASVQPVARGKSASKARGKSTSKSRGKSASKSRGKSASTPSGDPQGPFARATHDADDDEITSGNPLHGKWLTHKEIKALDDAGVRIRKGPFSTDEETRLRAAVTGFLALHNLVEEQLPSLLKRKTVAGSVAGVGGVDAVTSAQRKLFWRAVAEPFPDRTIPSIYHRLQRMFHPGNHQGAWSTAETNRLRSLIQQFGEKWQEIGEQLGRLPEACRTRWKTIRHYDIPGGSNVQANVVETAATPSVMRVQPSALATASSKKRTYMTKSDGRCLMALYLRAFLDETSTSPTTTSKISVRALEEMLARKAPLPWMSITYQFNRASTTIDKRNDDFIRSKWSTEWRSALLVHLRTAKAQDAAAWPPTRKLSFSEVYDLCTLTTAGQHSETENWTRDSDLALLKSVIGTFPRAREDADIQWSRIIAECGDDHKLWTARQIAKRFRFIIDFWLRKRRSGKSKTEQVRDAAFPGEPLHDLGGRSLYRVVRKVIHWLESMSDKQVRKYYKRCGLSGVAKTTAKRVVRTTTATPTKLTKSKKKDGRANASANANAGQASQSPSTVHALSAEFVESSESEN